MRRRYYCDYCDKSFIDDLEARKKHLQSSLHIKMRNIHYEANRDPRTILKEETEKGPCRRFMTDGFCPFSGVCKYTHYTPDQLWDVKERLDYETHTRNNLQVPTLESWLQKYYEKNTKEITTEQNLGTNHVPWSYMQSLVNRSDLPPSIRKFTPESFQSSNFEEWGK